MWLTARRAHGSVSRVLIRTWTTLAAHRRASGSSLRVDRWPSGARLLRWGPGLDGTSRQTGSRNNSLLRSVKANAEGPTVVVFMKQSYDLAGVQFHLIVHCGLEVELDTVNRRVCRSACSSDRSSTS